jgi:hypothetical protein
LQQLISASHSKQQLMSAISISFRFTRCKAKSKGSISLKADVWHSAAVTSSCSAVTTSDFSKLHQLPLHSMQGPQQKAPCSTLMGDMQQQSPVAAVQSQHFSD